MTCFFFLAQRREGEEKDLIVDQSLPKGHDSTLNQSPEILTNFVQKENTVETDNGETENTVIEGSIGTSKGENFLESPTVAKAGGEEICRVTEDNQENVIPNQEEKKTSKSEIQSLKEQKFNVVKEAEREENEVKEEKKERAEKSETNLDNVTETGLLQAKTKEPNLMVLEKDTLKKEKVRDQNVDNLDIHASVEEKPPIMDEVMTCTHKDEKDSTETTINTAFESKELEATTGQNEEAPIQTVNCPVDCTEIHIETEIRAPKKDESIESTLRPNPTTSQEELAEASLKRSKCKESENFTNLMGDEKSPEAIGPSENTEDEKEEAQDEAPDGPVQAASTVADADEGAEALEQKLNGLFTKCESLQRDNKGPTTVEVSKENNRDDEKFIIKEEEDNICNQEPSKVEKNIEQEKSKQNEGPEQSLLQQDETQMQKFEQSWSVISDKIELAALSEQTETITYIRDQGTNDNIEENLNPEKPTNPDDTSENETLEEKASPTEEKQGKNTSEVHERADCIISEQTSTEEAVTTEAITYIRNHGSNENIEESLIPEKATNPDDSSENETHVEKASPTEEKQSENTSEEHKRADRIISEQTSTEETVTTEAITYIRNHGPNAIIEESLIPKNATNSDDSSENETSVEKASPTEDKQSENTSEVHKRADSTISEKISTEKAVTAKLASGPSKDEIEKLENVYHLDFKEKQEVKNAGEDTKEIQNTDEACDTDIHKVAAGSEDTEKGIVEEEVYSVETIEDEMAEQSFKIESLEAAPELGGEDKSYKEEMNEVKEQKEITKITGMEEITEGQIIKERNAADLQSESTGAAKSSQEDQKDLRKAKEEDIEEYTKDLLPESFGKSLVRNHQADEQEAEKSKGEILKEYETVAVGESIASETNQNDESLERISTKTFIEEKGNENRLSITVTEGSCGKNRPVEVEEDNEQKTSTNEEDSEEILQKDEPKEKFEPMAKDYNQSFETSSLASEVCEEIIRAKILEEKGTTTDVSESAIVAVRTEGANLNAAEPEDERQVGSFGLAYDENASVTRVDDRDSNARLEDNSSICESKEENISPAEKRGADEVEEKPESKKPDGAPDPGLNNDDQSMVATGEMPMDDVLEENLKGSSALSIKGHEAMTTEVSKRIDEAPEYKNEAARLVAVAMSPLKEEDSLIPKDFYKLESVDIGKESSNEEVQDVKDREIYAHSEVNTRYNIKESEDMVDIPKREKTIESSDLSEASKSEDLKEDESLNLGLEGDKSEDGKPSKKIAEFVETSATCSDTEKDLLEDDNLGRSFGGSLNEGVEVEKAEEGLDIKSTKGFKANKTEDNSLLKEENLESPHPDEKLRCASNLITEDRSNETLTGTNNTNTVEDRNDVKDPDTQSVEETILMTQFQEGEQKTSEPTESRVRTKDHVDKTQDANEAIKDVILTEEVPQGIEKLDQNENIADKTIQEEEIDNKKLHIVTLEEQRANEVKDSKLVIIENLETIDSNEGKGAKENTEKEQKAQTDQHKVEMLCDDAKRSTIREDTSIKDNTTVVIGEEGIKQSNQGDERRKTNSEVYEDPIFPGICEDTEIHSTIREFSVTIIPPEFIEDGNYKGSHKDEKDEEKPNIEVFKEPRTTSNTTVEENTIETALMHNSSKGDEVRVKVPKFEMPQKYQTADESKDSEKQITQEDSTEEKGFEGFVGAEGTKESTLGKKIKDEEFVKEVMETATAGQGTEEQIIKDDSNKVHSTHIIEEETVAESSQENEASEGFERAGSSKHTEKRGIEECAIPDLSCKSAEEETVHQHSKYNEKDAINVKEEIKYSNPEFIEQKEVTGLAEETKKETLKDRVDSCKNNSALHTTITSEAEPMPETNENLIENSFLATEVSEEIIGAEILMKEEATTDISESKTVAIGTEKASLYDAELEDEKQVGSFGLAYDEKGLTETSRARVEDGDSNKKDEETRNIFERRYEKIPTAEQSKSDETEEKPEIEIPDGAPDTVSKSDDQSMIATGEIPMAAIIKENTKESSAQTLKEHEVMETEESKTIDDAPKEEKIEVAHIAEAMLTLKEEKYTVPKNFSKLEPIHTGENEEVHGVKDKEMYTPPELTTGYNIKESKEVDIPKREKTIEPYNSSETSKSKDLTDNESMNLELKREKSGDEEPSEKTFEFSGTSAMCSDTENELLEHENMGKNFEGSFKEGIEAEKAEDEVETKCHSHGYEISESESNNIPTDENVKSPHPEEKLICASILRSEDKSDKLLPETNKSKIEEDHNDVKDLDTQSVEEKILEQQFQEGEKETNETTESALETKETESALETKDYIEKIQNANETIKDVILTEKGAEQDDERGNIAEQITQEEEIDDQTLNVVKDSYLENHKTLDSKKKTETVTCELVEDLNREPETSPFAQATEDKIKHEVGRKKLVEASNLDSELSEVKVDTIKQANNCPEKLDTTSATAITEETSLHETQLDENPKKSLDVISEAKCLQTVEATENISEFEELESLELEETSALVTRLPTLECANADKKSTIVEHPGADEVQKTETISEAGFKARDQAAKEIDETEQSKVIKKPDTEKIEETIKEVSDESRYQAVEAISGDVNTSVHTISSGKSEEQLQESFSALLSKEWKHGTITMVEQAEDNEAKESKTLENDILKDSIATEAIGETSMPKEESMELNASTMTIDVSEEIQGKTNEVKKEEVKTLNKASRDNVTEAKFAECPSDNDNITEPYLSITKSSVEEILPREVEETCEVHSFEWQKTGRTSEYASEVENPELVTLVEKKSEEEHPKAAISELMSEEYQLDRITAGHTLPAGKSEEHLQAPSSTVLSSEQEYGMITTIEETESDHLKQNDNLEDPIATKMAEEMLLPKEEPIELKASTKVSDVIEDTEEKPNEKPKAEIKILNEAPIFWPQENESDAKFAEYLPKCQYITQPSVAEILSGEVSKKCEEVPDFKSEKTTKAFGFVSEVEISETNTQLEETNIEEEHLKTSMTKLHAEENQSEKAIEANEFIKNKISDNYATEKIAEESQPMSFDEKTTRESSTEDGQMSEEYSEEKAKETFKINKTEIQIKELSEEVENTDISESSREKIVEEDRSVKEPDLVLSEHKTIKDHHPEQPDERTVCRKVLNLGLENQGDECRVGKTEGITLHEEVNRPNLLFPEHDIRITGINDKEAVITKEEEEPSTNLDIPPNTDAIAEEAVPEKEVDEIKEVSEPIIEKVAHEAIKTYEDDKTVTGKSEIVVEEQKHNLSYVGTNVGESLDLKGQGIYGNEQKNSFLKETSQKEIPDKESKLSEDLKQHDRVFDKQRTREVSIPAAEKGTQGKDEIFPEIGTAGIEDAHENTQDSKQQDKTTCAISEKQIQSEADPNESTGTTTEECFKDKTDGAEVPPVLQKAVVEDQEPVHASRIKPEVKAVECGEKTMDNTSEEITEESTPVDLAKVSLSDLLERSTNEFLEAAGSVSEEGKSATSKKEEQTEEAATVQLKEAKADEEKDEEEEGDEHKKVDSSPEAPVMEAASRDKDVRIVHKKSHNILSGVGSKVKHSIAKVKKAITRKSSHPKQVSSKSN